MQGIEVADQKDLGLLIINPRASGVAWLGGTHFAMMRPGTKKGGITQMPSYNMNQLRVGLKVLLDGDPCQIVDADFVKPGKGQSFTRIKYKNLLSQRVNERTFKASDSVEGADVVDTSMQYLYSDGEFWYFMDTESYEQLSADSSVVGENVNWLKEEDMCDVTLWQGRPIVITPPNFVVLKVVETDPGLKGDTSSGGSKPATLETGAVVRVPLFIQLDELIKIDTRSGEYVSRAKE